MSLSSPQNKRWSVHELRFAPPRLKLLMRVRDATQQQSPQVEQHIYPLTSLFFPLNFYFFLFSIKSSSIKIRSGKCLHKPRGASASRTLFHSKPSDCWNCRRNWWNYSPPIILPRMGLTPVYFYLKEKNVLLTAMGLRSPSLFLKSPQPDAHQSTVDAGAREYVNLCTPTKTFRLRQVHSSNSVHLIRPSNGSVPSNGEADEPAELDFAETVTAVAKCASTLELHTLEEGLSSTQFLERSLRLYDRPSSDGDVQMTGSSSDLTLSESKRVKEGIFDDIPMSISECETAWKDLCAFVHSNTTTGGELSSLTGFRPSAKVKLDVWKRMLEGSVLQGIDIEKQFLVKDLWKAVLDDSEDEPFPRPLFQAVVRRLAESSGSNDNQDYDSEVKCKFPLTDCKTVVTLY
jgi:hypothetical protein